MRNIYTISFSTQYFLFESICGNILINIEGHNEKKKIMSCMIYDFRWYR